MMRCFSTLGCPDATLAEVLALATRHRIEALELRALGGTVDLPSYWRTAGETPTSLAATMAASPIKVVAIDLSLKLADSTDDDWLDALATFLPWAEALGGVNLRVFDGGKTADTATLERMTRRVAWWQDLRGTRGWRSDIMIETHDSLFTAAAINALTARAPAARILWDSHHTWKRGGEDPLVTWQAIKPQVVHVHVKDSISTPSARHPFTYVLPGEGEFPAAPLLTNLQAEFCGPVSLEWEKLWHPYLPDLPAALTAATQRHWW